MRTQNRIRQLPDLIDHRKIAHKIGVEPQTIRNWVEAGEWPIPLVFCKTLYFYRLDDFASWGQRPRLAGRDEIQLLGGRSRSGVPLRRTGGVKRSVGDSVGRSTRFVRA